jgi:hypothetical protein
MSADARHTYRKERKGRGELKGFFALLAISAVIFEGGW